MAGRRLVHSFLAVAGVLVTAVLSPSLGLAQQPISPLCVSGCLNYSVSVTPHGGTLTVSPNANHTASFTVVNTGDYTDTYTFSCSRTLGVSCVSVSPTSATLDPGGPLAPLCFGCGGGSSITVTVTYHVGATVDGNVYLTATGHASNQGWYTVKPTPVTPTGPLVERDLCLTIAAGSDAAYECGDLRIVHPLPSTRTLNKVRTPTLLYNVQSAYPFPSLNADLALAANDRPDSIVAIARLKIGGSFIQRDRRAWAGTQWGSPSQAATRRVMTNFSASDLSTGLYAFQLELDKYVTGTGYIAIRTDTGSVVILNRLGSYFGAGWWLAGFEQLQFLSDGSILWIGGDGSSRRYVKTNCCTGTTWYVARAFDGRDSLSYSGGTYTRHLKAGVKVVFNSSGFHIQTVNRLGYATVFAPDGASRLLSITLPPSPSNRTYTFQYAGPNGTLSSIDAPDVTGLGRVTRVIGTAVTGGARITSITDPGIAASVQFGYDSVAHPGTITRRTDRRGNTHWYKLGVGMRLVGDSLPVAGAHTIAQTFCPAEVRAWSCGSGLTAPESTYTIYDGPRTDSADVIHFWTDSLGAVSQIRDPYGRLTSIARTNATWPELPTRVQGPGGFVTGATYDLRGNLATVSDSNPYANGLNPTTRYTWNQTWDQLTQVVQPNGQVTQLGVDAANGNRLWVQDARGTINRTTFGYNSSGNGAYLLSTITPPIGAVTTVGYDSQGNTSYVASSNYYPTWYQSDANGKLIFLQTAIGAGQVRTDSVAYDAADRTILTSSWAPAHGGAEALRLTTYNAYDNEGNLTQSQLVQSPDHDSLGPLTTQWVFDAANRSIVRIAPDGIRDTSWYGPSGNVDSAKARTGHIVRMTYDRLNRLVKRIVPEVSYAARTTPGNINTLDLLYDNYPDSLQGRPYPWFPNNGSGLKIFADTAVFAYAPDGSLLKADNGDARIHRTYFINGQLARDSLWIRNYSSGTFGHLYVLRHTYDVNGRLASIHHPSQLAVGTGMRDSVSYVYSDTTGDLNQVTALLGNAVTFGYDTRGQLVRKGLPGQIVDSMVYDSLGRMTLDQVANGSLSPYKDPDSYLRLAQLAWADLTRVSSAKNSHGWKDTVTATYSGLGQLTSLTYERPQNLSDSVLYVYIGGDGASQSFTYDPLGNAYAGYSSVHGNINYENTFSQGSTSSSFYQAGTGRLTSMWDAGGHHDAIYDSAGNTVFYYGGSANLFDERASWYSADDRLRVAEWRHAEGDMRVPAWKDVFDEYRYDALGRRVLVMSRRSCWLGGDSLAFSDCQMGLIRRTVWDGNQELWEIQRPYASEEIGPADDNGVYLETDTGPAAPWAGLDYRGLWADPGPLFGQTAYTYAGALDQPIGITRLNLLRRTNQGQFSWPPVEVFPLWNWRGEADLGTFGDGGVETCVDGSHCVEVQWRGLAFATGLTKEALWSGPNIVSPTPNGWFGTLIQGKEDGAGTLYRRNRSVDPATGRFTQEDPIGLAGGFNLYGLANGDPINFSDPFGLCPYTGKHTTNVDDCPKDTVGDAFRLLKSEGGQEGRSTIILVATNKADVKPLSQSKLDRICKDQGATGCNTGKTIYILEGQSKVDNATRLTHEATHFFNRPDEEALAWRRALTVWGRFDAALAPAMMANSWYKQWSDACRSGATEPTYCP